MSENIMPNLNGMRDLKLSFSELLSKVKKTERDKKIILDEKTEELKESYNRFESINYTKEDLMEFARASEHDFTIQLKKDNVKTCAKALGVSAMFLILLVGAQKTNIDRTQFSEFYSGRLNNLKEQVSFENESQERKYEEALKNLNMRIEDGKKREREINSVTKPEYRNERIREPEFIDFRDNVDDTMEALTAVNEVVQHFSKNNNKGLDEKTSSSIKKIKKMYGKNRDIEEYLNTENSTRSKNKKIKGYGKLNDFTKGQFASEIDDRSEAQKNQYHGSEYGEYFDVKRHIGRPRNDYPYRRGKDGKEDIFYVKGEYFKAEFNERENDTADMER